jgi:iron complex outermembrane recepter protein
MRNAPRIVPAAQHDWKGQELLLWRFAHELCRDDAMLWFVLLFAPLNEVPPLDETNAVFRQRVDVVGVTPIDGIGIPLERYPANVQRVLAGEDRALDAIAERAASVQQSEVVGNRWQRDLLFRGFLASPLLGAPEGLAVFRDGVRMNEPFGDTVNWDTVPDAAIRSIELIPGSIGAFGLNALGGVVSLRTKDGFADPGAAVSVAGGSFGTLDTDLSIGWNRVARGHFLALTHQQEEGWRDFSPSDRSGLFSSSVWAFDRASVDLRVNLGRSHLTGNGGAPIQLVAEDRRQVFTHPDLTRNRTAAVSSAMTRQFAFGTLEANAHWRRTSTIGANGDDTPYEPCDDDPSILCLDDAGPVLDPSGSQVRLTPENPLDAVVNRNRTRQAAYGATAQISRSSSRQRSLIGVSTDAGNARFLSWSELANLASSRAVESIGVTAADSLVEVDTRLLTTSIFLANIFELTPAFATTASIRANRSRLVLDDQLGVALDGDHRFTSINPSIGLTYATRAGVLFGGVTQSSRTPTPVELTCADEEAPCRLPNAFVSDPPLEQVIARTIEAGMRGKAGAQSWSVALFRTNNRDDIIFVSSGRVRGEGYFENAGRTRREGIELIAGGSVARRSNWYASYSLIDATFRDTFSVASPHHPEAAGAILVEPGDRIPQIPRHTAKGGITVQTSERTWLGVHVRSLSSSYYRGDEGNLAPALPGYTVVDLRSRFSIGRDLSLHLALHNATNTRYATFGTFGEADDILGDDYDDPRFVTPAAPRNVRIGVTWRR